MTRAELEVQLPDVRRRMTGWARARLRRDDVEDLVQEALLQVLLTRDRIEGDDATPWAFGVLRNVMRHSWREAGRASFVSLVNAETGEEVDLPVAAGAQAQDQEARHEAQDALQVIAALPAERQALFLDVAVLGLTLEEAASAHGLPLGTVKSRVHRTTAAVRAALRGRPLPKRWDA